MSEKETYEAPEMSEIGDVTELTREFGKNCSEMFASGPNSGITFGQCSGTAFS